MASVNIQPKKLLDLTKKTNDKINEYKKNYKKLISIINKNEAKLDKKTQEALLVSINKINDKYTQLESVLTTANEATKNVANAFKKKNDQAVSTLLKNKLK